MSPPVSRTRLTDALRVAVPLLCLLIASAAFARWPDGVLNYCGFDGVWDEAGWRDIGWAQGGTPGISFDREVKKFGKASLRIEGSATEKRCALQINGNTIQKGKQYVMRCWVKTKDIAGEAAIALQPHAEGKPLEFLDLGPASRLSGTHDWTLLEVKVPPFPPDAVRMYSYIWVVGTGTAWFDEFSLAEEGVQVPLGGQKPITDADYAGVRFDDANFPANLLPNPGFEDGLSGWYVEFGKPAIDEQVYAEGKRSLRYDGFPECSFTTVAIHVRIDPRRAYRLSFKLKTDLTAGLSCVQAIPFKANGEGFGWWFSQDHTDEFCHGRGRQDWHEETLVMREFEPETDFLNIYLQLQDAVGKVWWDDMKLTPLSMAETKAVRGR
jgi:hypothetical protein